MMSVVAFDLSVCVRLARAAALIVIMTIAAPLGVANAEPVIDEAAPASFSPRSMAPPSISVSFVARS
jgi:hypothetical protein